MLLNTYEARNLLCNLSFNGATSQADTHAFRGDLVLEEGDIADDSGRRMPPKSVVKQAVLLASGDKLLMAAGILVELNLLPLFIQHYRGDLAPGIRVLFYVENLGKALRVDLDGVDIILLPHPDGGAVWNTLMDDLRLDKDDFKGQSAEDKVITVYQTLLDFQPKLDSPSYEEALGHTIAPRRAARGPV
ncbi:hypothetical protein [Stutzerimonas kirkiae]|uniref:Uncharacterized protein n=1 Tax=Stutzerimonas kirkiae TaxID=2211392 RepID=A0A4Q9RCI3_9GAMM|nr:hypothetical protein [Stutzerimonas kirkiae]TBU98814.1 hypothetical protein DNJ96_03625 [Stutzerimonas kirkiae]TBV03908.1 hypothetical protein DNJ95_06035 [Stutzerimonas kirkiae]TBV09679.1 hypothetical protein DNK08_08605 [Stutzerimonas kirkiae]TBV16788.1 hypothetical protein DNK01_02745 [Stutzerimonas kirkiae]